MAEFCLWPTSSYSLRTTTVGLATPLALGRWQVNSLDAKKQPPWNENMSQLFVVNCYINISTYYTHTRLSNEILLHLDGALACSVGSYSYSLTGLEYHNWDISRYHYTSRAWGLDDSLEQIRWNWLDWLKFCFHCFYGHISHPALDHQTRWKLEPWKEL